jgi:hypothetical protein
LPFYFITKSSAVLVLSLSAVVILRSLSLARLLRNTARACECVFAQQRNSNARAVTDKFYFPNEGGSLIVLRARARAPNQISKQRKHTHTHAFAFACTSESGCNYLFKLARCPIIVVRCGLSAVSCFAFCVLCLRCVLNSMAIAPRFV